MITPVPSWRVAPVNDAPIRTDGDYVLYWMIAHRRTRWNFSLEHALNRARELGKPLLVLEALRVGYPWASDRIHRFVIDGMAVNQKRCEAAGVRYFAYVEPKAGDGAGLLETLAERAVCVVTDEFPCFFLPRMVVAAGKKLEAAEIALEQVDTNGLMPLRLTEKAYTTAYSFRRFLQKTLPDHLEEFPRAEPLDGYDLGTATIARDVLDRWTQVPAAVLRGDDDGFLAGLPIDHDVTPLRLRGGSVAGEEVAERFLDERLARYADDRNQPQQEVASGLSPYLHFGHVSAHMVVANLMKREDWNPGRLSPRAVGKREGWWGTSRAAESFLDEIVTWREVGYTFGHHRPDDYDRFESLPDWAQATLDEHAHDRRDYTYTSEQFANSETHDDLWNAAQMQLRHEGIIHNYLRMLWGKKILEWTKTPREALDVLIELNNRYAIDGRNPNSYSGIFWTLGRFDRAWGPVRPIFGTVRFMSSENTARKVRVKDYIARHLEPGLFG